jgi:hypothetical protein
VTTSSIEAKTNARFRCTGMLPSPVVLFGPSNPGNRRDQGKVNVRSLGVICTPALRSATG